jgi:hypothetical protein
MAVGTHLNFITFIDIFIVTYRWWESHIMEWNLPFWLPATNKQTYLTWFWCLTETVITLQSALLKCDSFFWFKEANVLNGQFLLSGA